MFKKIKNSFTRKKSSQEIIAEIHYEFDTASDRLLLEANRIIHGVDTSGFEKAERLKSVGFRMAKIVTEVKEKKNQAESNKKLAELILYYQVWYPNNKFITEEAVKSVCEKYGLVFGPADRYNGDVPEKNLRDIEAFSLRDEDKEKHDCGWYNPHGKHPTRLYSIEDTTGASWGYVERAEGRDRFFDFIFHYKPQDVKFVQTAKPLQICAPASDFNMSNMEIRGHKLVKVEDPIVLQPVNGGYLVVTKWGLEASDEMVINEKQN